MKVNEWVWGSKQATQEESKADPDNYEKEVLVENKKPPVITDGYMYKERTKV